MTTLRSTTAAARNRLLAGQLTLLLSLVLTLLAACGNGGTGGPRY